MCEGPEEPTRFGGGGGPGCVFTGILTALGLFLMLGGGGLLAFSLTIGIGSEREGSRTGPDFILLPLAGLVLLALGNILWRRFGRHNPW